MQTIQRRVGKRRQPISHLSLLQSQQMLNRRHRELPTFVSSSRAIIKTVSCSCLSSVPRMLTDKVADSGYAENGVQSQRRKQRHQIPSTRSSTGSEPGKLSLSAVFVLADCVTYICPPRLLHLLFGIALYRWPPGSQRATRAQTGANGGSIG